MKTEPCPSDYGTRVRIFTGPKNFLEFGESRGPSYFGTVMVQLDSGEEEFFMERDLRVVER